MKTIHWTMKNSSGMHRVAESMAKAELAMGVDARVLDPFDPQQQGWEIALDADIHLNHTHIPETIGGKSFKKSCTKPYRWVFPVHGTPEHVFEASIENARENAYNSGTSFAHHQRGMQEADAILTFWERHQALYQLGTDKHTIVDLIPMGIDLDYWKGGTSPGKYSGNPAFINAENHHPFKWGFYMLRMWPWVRQELHEAMLHVINVPGGVQRFLDVMGARYGFVHGCVYGSWAYPHSTLRNIYKAFDFYLSSVRYGDHNRACLEAGAAGLKIISFPGNPYADYWMQEGDDRYTVRDLIAIGRGDVAPRADKKPVPSLRDMAEATINVYERILDRPQTNWCLGTFADPLPPVVRDAIADSCGVKEFQSEPDMRPEMVEAMTLLTALGGGAPPETAAAVLPESTDEVVAETDQALHAGRQEEPEAPATEPTPS